jgi:hypothetical protein
MLAHEPKSYGKLHAETENDSERRALVLIRHGLRKTLVIEEDRLAQGHWLNLPVIDSIGRSLNRERTSSR